MYSFQPSFIPGRLIHPVRVDMQQQICDILQNRVDEFIDSANYDWLIVKPAGQASSYIINMISYLKKVMASLHHLPEQARVAALRAATKRIAVRLRNLVLEPAVRKISPGALDQLHLDVKQFEQFAESGPVTGLRDSEMLHYFASLRQLLDLFESWDWSAYLQHVGIEGGEYPLVTPRDVATLLEKYKEPKEHSSVFTGLTKTQRDKKKYLAIILKEVKCLQNQDCT